MESGIRETLAILNERPAKLETMNAACAAVRRCLDGAPGDCPPELRAWLEDVRDGLSIDGAPLTRSAVVVRIADAQTALRAALAMAEGRDPTLFEGSAPGG
ncbi:MAG TPA: hypothetical protein VF746_19555 [Longimicrobium sp.]